MGTGSALRVHYDGSAFFRHRRSGITRYLTELVSAFDEAPELGVEPVLPFRYVANAHLADARPDRFRQVPLPSRFRAGVFDRLNRRAGRRTPGVPGLRHHSLYEPHLLDPSIPQVCTVYDFSFELFPEHFGDTRSHLADKERFLRECQLLLCISETTLADLRRVHPDLDTPAVVTPLAAGAGFHDPRPARLRGVPERYVLHVGNRHPHKNTDTLFRAFAQVAAAVPDVDLVLCGAYLPQEPARLRELGIADRTHLLRVRDTELPWLYHRAEVFAFPSRYEGFGLPLVEAMAAGCPVVSSDAPALVEVAEGVAEYFAPDDEQMLAAHLLRLLGDAAARDAMRERGRVRARDFTWHRTATATARAYDQAVRP